MIPLAGAFAERLPAGRTTAILVPDSVFRPAAIVQVSESNPPVGMTSVVLQTVGEGLENPVVDRHLRVEAGSRPPWPALADVVTGRCAPERLARQYPGALITASPVHAECRIGLGDLEAVRIGVVSTEPFWPMWSSVLHAWLAAGLPVTAVTSATGYAVRRPSAGVEAEQSVLLRRVR